MRGFSRAETTRMRVERFEGHFFRDLLLAVRDDRDDMAMRNGRMNEDARGRHMRHDGHQIDGLMARRLIDAQGVCQAPMIIAGVRDAAHDRDGHALHAISAVEAVHRADEAGCVAACELQELLVDTLFKVCIAVEEHVGHVVFLAALEDGLFAVLLIENAIFRADARVGRVEQDVTLLNELGERTGNGMPSASNSAR